jgi:23S rRNA pseudouridine1911/1915/1917 synthase
MQHVFRRVTVPAALAGRRLDQAAAALLGEFSRNRLKQWIEGGQLTVGGAAAAPRARLKGGEELVLRADLEPAVAVAPEPIALSIVHEDAELFVVAKPAGLVVHPGAGNPSGTLQNALLNLDPALSALPRAGLVHRLDKDTSGLLVIARTLSVQQALATAIERRKVQRVYRAICQGALTGGGTIEAPIGRHPRERTKMAVNERGRAARTRYRVVERFRAHTHIELELDTGRTHQIRVHMAHIRAPLVGDPVYGGRPRLPRQPTERLREALQAFRRQALHATRLTLTHPRTAALLTFESPLPEDMAALLAALAADRDSAGAAR